ncbi:MAG TPA: MbtH family protein [Roseiflexaceae bacterium]|jgi:MbtH protein|nr:MbtH family protein [Roseiflexaceae bacterium]
MDEQYNQDNAIYIVVVNGEGQFSLWPAERELPAGWNEAGFSGSKPECLAYIKKKWTEPGG